MSPRSLTAVVALLLFKTDSDRGNLGLIVERQSGEALRNSSQELVTEITLLPTAPITSKMDGSYVKSQNRLCQKKLLEEKEKDNGAA